MKQRRNLMVGIALFVITVVLYWPVMAFPFINFDDELYVYQNPVVIQGLSWHGMAWAFTNSVSYWQPLTILSHMADCSMFHLWAGGHHLTNVVLHATNVVLLWILIRCLSGLYWPSVLVAILFAGLPLNVEAVAWVSERNHVLSTLFFILTLLAYLRYAEKPGTARYLLALAIYALGLLAKPMLVTLPFVLLLLDYWPLRRISPPQDSLKVWTGKSIPFLLCEKIPFLALAVAVCIITYVAQNRAGAVVSSAELPLVPRLLNIPVSYLTYLEKIFWPSKLCIYYSFPERIPVTLAVICSLLLAVGTCAVWHWRLKFRWLAVGWLWFLGTLVPHIGVVQAGGQAWADRFAYLPEIGIFLIVGCGLNELWMARPSWRAFIVAATGLFLCLCLVVTRQQINYWQNSIVLYSHAIAIDPMNARAQDLLGRAYSDAAKFNMAEEHFAVAVRLKPKIADYEDDLGLALIDSRRFTDAISPLTSAIQLKPGDMMLRNTLGAAFMLSGDPHKAEEVISQAITLQPQYPLSYYNLGVVLMKEELALAAITNFDVALQLQPNWPEALSHLAGAYAAEGNLSNAVSAASSALTMAQADNEMELAKQISNQLSDYQIKSMQQSP